MSNRNGFLIAVVMVAGLLSNSGMADAGSADGDFDDEIDCFRAQGCPRCNASFLLELNLARGSESCGEAPWPAPRPVFSGTSDEAMDWVERYLWEETTAECDME